MSEFAETNRRLNYEKEMLKKLKSERIDLISRLEEMGRSKLTAASASIYLSYISRIKNDENQRKTVIYQIGKELKEKRAELVDALKKKKVLETLKEKQMQEYKRSLIKREQKQLNEAGILRAGVRGRV